MNKNSDKKLQYYLSLLDMSYMEVIKSLLKKYGAVRDDYFRKESYYRFLNGEIKSISRGKYSRAKEGLYTHHIAEINHPNLANRNYIGHLKYDFKYQVKDKLVYCDLFEHIALHALIFIDSDGHYGKNGYDFLRNMAIQWYTTDMVPKPMWMQKVYERAYLNKKQTMCFLETIEKDKMHGIKAKGNPQDDEMARFLFKELLLKKLKIQTPEEEEKAWQKSHPLLVRNKIDPKIPRKKLLKLLYEAKYYEDFNSLNLFIDSQLNKIRDDLLDDYEKILENKA